MSDKLTSIRDLLSAGKLRDAGFVLAGWLRKNDDECDAIRASFGPPVADPRIRLTGNPLREELAIPESERGRFLHDVAELTGGLELVMHFRGSEWSDEPYFGKYDSEVLIRALRIPALRAGARDALVEGPCHQTPDVALALLGAGQKLAAPGLIEAARTIYASPSRWDLNWKLPHLLKFGWRGDLQEIGELSQDGFFVRDLFDAATESSERWMLDAAERALTGVRDPPTGTWRSRLDAWREFDLLDRLETELEGRHAIDAAYDLVRGEEDRQLFERLEARFGAAVDESNTLSESIGAARRRLATTDGAFHIAHEEHVQGNDDPLLRLASKHLAGRRAQVLEALASAYDARAGGREAYKHAEHLLASGDLKAAEIIIERLSIGWIRGGRIMLKKARDAASS